VYLEIAIWQFIERIIFIWIITFLFFSFTRDFLNVLIYLSVLRLFSNALKMSILTLAAGPVESSSNAGTLTSIQRALAARHTMLALWILKKSFPPFFFCYRSILTLNAPLSLESSLISTIGMSLPKL
jgi:hypothetical protein